MEFVGDDSGRMRHPYMWIFDEGVDVRFDDFHARHLFVIVAEANKILIAIFGRSNLSFAAQPISVEVALETRKMLLDQRFLPKKMPIIRSSVRINPSFRRHRRYEADSARRQPQEHRTPMSVRHCRSTRPSPTMPSLSPAASDLDRTRRRSHHS